MDGAGTAHLTADHDLDARLRAAGLRATAARRSVLTALDDLGGHRSADEILAAVRSAGRPIARASVFNGLRDLVAVGLAVQVDAPGAARYELVGAGHHHFVCDRCGEITDVPYGSVDGARLTADLPGARIAGATVVFRGECATCVADQVTRPRRHVRRRG